MELPFFRKKEKSEAGAELPETYEEGNMVCEIVGATEDMLIFRCHPRMTRGPSCLVIVDSEGIKAPSTPECREAVEYLKNIKLYSFTGVKKD